MSDDLLPHALPIRKSVASGARYSGSIATDGLSRISEVVLRSVDKFQVALDFAETDCGRPGTTVKVTGKVVMECQRCLQPVEVYVATDSQLAFVRHDQEARSVVSGVDPWIVSDDRLDLLLLVEEEVLLSLPPVAMHDKGEADIGTGEQRCVDTDKLLDQLNTQHSDSFADALTQGSVSGAIDNDPAGSGQNPFEVLKNISLKTQAGD